MFFSDIFIFYFFTFVVMLILSLIIYICLSSKVMAVTFSLVGVFFLTGVLLCFLSLEFFGLVYITVYVGAVCVFFIFALLIFDLRLNVFYYGYENIIFFWPLGILFFLLNFFLSGFLYLSFYCSKANADLLLMSFWFGLFTTTNVLQNIKNFEIIERSDLRWWLLNNATSADGISLFYSLLDFEVDPVLTWAYESPFLPTYLQYKLSYLVHEFGSFFYNYNQFFIFVLTMLLFVAMLGSLSLILKR